MKISNSEILTYSRSNKKATGEPYLKIKLDKETKAILPMQPIQEVLVVEAEDITPIPYMPNCMLGLLNKRSRVFWLVDLAQLLELEAISRDSQQYNIAILRVDESVLALAVPEIQGVSRIDSELLQSPVGYVSAGLVPYLSSCLLTIDEVLLTLEPQAILSSPILQQA